MCIIADGMASNPFFFLQTLSLDSPHSRIAISGVQYFAAICDSFYLYVRVRSRFVRSFVMIGGFHMYLWTWDGWMDQLNAGCWQFSGFGISGFFFSPFSPSRFRGWCYDGMLLLLLRSIMVGGRNRGLVGLVVFLWCSFIQSFCFRRALKTTFRFFSLHGSHCLPFVSFL